MPVTGQTGLEVGLLFFIGVEVPLGVPGLGDEVTEGEKNDWLPLVPSDLSLE